MYHPYAAGILAGLAYILILLAMNFVTIVSFIQAFRQLSLPLGALFGHIFLKEKITLQRKIALVMIFSGLLLSLK
jgi:drug/metabolite transporter (DMT)-like permease